MTRVRSSTVIVTLTPLPGLANNVAEAMRAEIDEIRLAEGCELYEMYRRVDVIVLVERWSNRDTWPE